MPLPAFQESLWPKILKAVCVNVVTGKYKVSRLLEHSIYGLLGVRDRLKQIKIST